MYNPTLNHGVDLNINLRASSEKIKILLDKAVDFMTNTKDPSHGIEHIHNLLQETNRFFASTGDKFDMDRDVLSLALFWHDVWKSQIKPNWRNYLFLQLYEGLGSMFMFRKHARTAGLPPEMIRSVSYAIRKHSAIQGIRAQTLEAQLLWDVDTLEAWNMQRTRDAFRRMGWINVSALDSYIRYMKRAGFHLYFEWTRNEVGKIAPLFFDEMSKIRESLVNGKRGG